jgi:hypothetical protein
MMASPIEFRQYLRYFTLQDGEVGVQPLRQPQHGVTRLFMPPQLQFRHKEKIHVDGQPTLEWSPWIDVLYVCEGDDAPPTP